MHLDQFEQFVRENVDSDPSVRFLNFAAAVEYINKRGQTVLALVTEDGKHRVVMLNDEFVTNEETVRGLGQ